MTPRTVLEEGATRSGTDDWVERLLPYHDGVNPVLHAVYERRLRDGNNRLQLGAVDQSFAATILWFLERPARHDRPNTLLFQLPRGDHDVALLLGIVVQMGRIYAQSRRQDNPADFAGSVTIVGSDTAVQQRLAEVQFERIDLDEGLQVHKVRSDGRLRRPDRSTISFRAGASRLLYLNTRVGWPRLPSEDDGVVIIDRTSFRNPDLFEKALVWAHEHGARRLIAVADRGDRETAQRLDGYGPLQLTWPVTEELISHLERVVGPEATASPLSSNVLLTRGRTTLELVGVDAPPIEQLMRQTYFHIKAAYEVEAAWPYPLAAARRLLNTLTQLVGTTDNYDSTAALDHRARTITSLSNAVASDMGLTSGPWYRYTQTRWGALKHEMVQLTELVRRDNPKFLALLISLDRLHRQDPSRHIVVRTASSAAAAALHDDLVEFDPELADRERITIAPWSHRRPWTGVPTIEVLPALPPRSRRSILWTGEATDTLLIGYAWERDVLRHILTDEAQTTSEQLRRTFSTMRLGAPPPTVAREPTVRYEVEGITATVDTSRDPFEVDLTGLIADLESLEDAIADDVETATRTSRDQTDLTTEARPVFLEPAGTDIWWVRTDAVVETLLGDRYHHVPVDELHPSDEVIVPRGDGREDLFTRLVAASHRDGHVQEMSIVMDRWRRACRRVIEDSGGDLSDAQRRLEQAGCHAVRQLRAWANGSTIAPQRAEDIRCVARVAGDEWLVTHYLRIARLAQELRGLHRSIGHTISGAMREIVRGRGPNLQALADLLDTDPAEILDEFDVRTVQRVGQLREIPAPVAGTVQPSSSHEEGTSP